MHLNKYMYKAFLSKLKWYLNKTSLINKRNSCVYCENKLKYHFGIFSNLELISIKEKTN